jgi:L-rhamnonate dehydratase
VLDQPSWSRYTRYGYKQLLDSGAVDLLQPDITWLGGITEARRVIAMASANNIPVVPHGSSVFSYHVVTAFQSCPMSEFVTPELDKITGYFGGLFTGEPIPKDGWVEIPDEPGFGLTLIRDGLRRCVRLSTL